MRRVALLSLTALIGCLGTADDPSPMGGDGGSAADAAPAPYDAGLRSDSGAGEDAATNDAGSPADAASLPDAGSHADAGRPPDGGARPDAGAWADGGVDAGSPADAGAEVFTPCPTDTACKIMPLGDSITDGVGMPGGGGYRIELFRQSGADRKAITFVGSLTNGPATVDGRSFPQHHEGHSGYTIDDAQGRAGIYPLVQQALSTHQPHIVLLMIGTNDVSIQADLANAPNRLGRLLDRITSTSPNLLVVVAKIVPSQGDSLNNNIQSYNAGVAQVVNQRIAAGKHLILVDMYAPLAGNPNYKTELLSDYLHPSPAGYAVMARTWYPVIKPFLPDEH